LLFTSHNIADVESDSFEVISGKLQIIESDEQLNSVPCGIQWSHQPSVRLIDVGGNSVLRYVNISCNVHSFVEYSSFNASRNIIYSETTRTSSSRARFVSIRSSYLGKNILSFNADGIFNTSNVFTVLVGPVHAILLLQQPSTGTVGYPLSTQPHLRVIDACNNSVLSPILIQVEIICGSLNRTTLSQYRIENVSEIHFENISSNLACSKNYLAFTCILCGLNSSNITSRSVFFEVRSGALKNLAFSEVPKEILIAGTPYALPPVLLFDVGLNQVLESGYVLNISVNFRNERLLTTSILGIMGTAKMPQFQLNISGMYSCVVSSSDSNVLVTSIYVLPGHLEKMHFKDTPTNAVSERPIPVIEIFLFDMFGNLLVNTSHSVILRLVDRPFNSLQGNLMVFSLNGIATFHDISIGNARVDHRLVATSSNLSFSSETFDVNPGDIFVLKIAETVSSVALSQYLSSGFFPE